MISFPNCKINLGLSIINKRIDGYHNLETIFYPLAVRDVLEIVPVQEREEQPVDQVQFSTSGLKIDGNRQDNLCLKAYNLLLKDFPQLPLIRMHLHKVIPMGAGLGGGSADGAFVLKLLNRMFDLNLSTEVLVNYASILGSDCPFFILNSSCFATGRGEIMEPIELDLSGYSIAIVNNGIPVNTGWAFAQLSLEETRSTRLSKNLKDILASPVSGWKDILVNDFEKPVFEKHPILKNIKDSLYLQGALYASMSGSGSTIYGIFEKGNVPGKLAGLDDIKLQVA